MYSFRLLRKKKKSAEHRKVLGVEPNPMQLTNIMRNVMDPNSKQVSATAEMDKKFMADSAAGYKLLCEHADIR